MTLFLNYLDTHTYQHFEDREYREKCSGSWVPEDFVGCQHIEIDQAPIIALYRPILVEVLEEVGWHVRGLCYICLREQMLMERKRVSCSLCSRRRALARHWVVSLEITEARIMAVCETCYPKESMQTLIRVEKQADKARKDRFRERSAERVAQHALKARVHVLH